jgi:hypothetical protein
LRVASASCHEITRLIATTPTSFQIPSSSRKLSKADPACWTLLHFFTFIATFIVLFPKANPLIKEVSSK